MPFAGPFADNDALNNLVFHCSADVNGRLGLGRLTNVNRELLFNLLIPQGISPFVTLAVGVSDHFI